MCGPRCLTLWVLLLLKALKRLRQYLVLVSPLCAGGGLKLLQPWGLSLEGAEVCWAGG